MTEIRLRKVLKRARAKRCFSLKRHLKRQKAVNIPSHMDFIYETLQARAAVPQPLPKFRLDLYKVGPNGGINHG